MTMIHELKPQYRLKRRKRVGRGGKRGTYSGHGLKGQKARAGAKMKAMEREFILRLPKQRGVKFQSYLPEVTVINLANLEERFSPGETVSPKTLAEKGFIQRSKENTPIKILGKGSLRKKLSFSGVALSRVAKEYIESHGGTIRHPQKESARKS
jgi:large subunit ribosomal protein L15